MGVTKETIERNVLKPMREIYGNAIGEINNRNVATICGEEAYCLGAEKINQLSKIQGATFKYLYGDEVAKWNEEVFNFAKSRLRTEYSCFDGTLNPESPNHYLYKFIYDSPEIDIYAQHYVIDDNPNYPEKEKEALKKEYAGTIYYDRYILGLWKQAEGSIYTQFVNNPDLYKWNFGNKKENGEYENPLPKFMEISVALDFGGTKSGHAFVGTGTTYGYDKFIALKSKKYMNKDYINGVTSAMLQKWSIEFVREIIKEYGRCDYFEWDNENTVLGNDIAEAMRKEFPQVTVRPCYKATIKERIELKVKLIGQQRYYYTEDAELVKKATCEAIYDKTKLEDERLDDFTSDIDTLDAEEYTFTRNIYKFIQA